MDSVGTICSRSGRICYRARFTVWVAEEESMMSKFVLTTEPRPGVRVIALSRPEKKNALTRDMYDAAGAALKAADAAQTVRVVCVTGSGDAFTAGNDIAGFRSGPPPFSEQVGPSGLIAFAAA